MTRTMLSYLRVRNVAVLREVEVSFGAGLNVLTGETGAGKSLLVGAVGLLLGERADGGQVRQGEDAASVEGMLSVGSPEVEAMLGALGLPASEDGSLLVRREVRRGAPNRVFVNGCLAPLTVLRQIISRRVALHGQNRHLTLGSPECQRELLDTDALSPESRRRLSEAWRSLDEAATSHLAYQARAAERVRRLEWLGYQLREIEAVHPRPGEEEHLRAEERLLATAEQRARLSAALTARLTEEDEAVTGTLARATADLVLLAGLDSRLRGAVEKLREAALLVEDVAEAVRGGAPRDDLDSGRLDSVQERLAALQALRRKYGGDLAEVVAFSEQAHRELAELQDHEGTTQRLARAEADAARRFHALALEAAEGRRRAASRITERVGVEMGGLGLAGARFAIRIDASPPADAEEAVAVHAAGSPAGYDRVEFLFAAQADEEPRALARVASGGELSRLMLALNLAVDGGGGSAPGTACVFDEVDAGIGGAAARQVGERLKRAARRHQVICVTHLAEVAALADIHLRITKRVSGGRGVTTVERLDGEARVAELARMIGEKVSPETARHHARALLSGRDGGRPASGARDRPAARIGRAE